MKNVHPATPGFVLTSISYKFYNSLQAGMENNQHTAGIHKSSIAKFDYCLPPDIQDDEPLNTSGFTRSGMV